MLRSFETPNKARQLEHERNRGNGAQKESTDAAKATPQL